MNNLKYYTMNNDELVKEAVEYENEFLEPDGSESIDFIAGANSKWVEKEKIKFAIEHLKWVMKNEYCPFPLFSECNGKLKNLEEKLLNL